MDVPNWHVITGAPSSGKTTLIDCLSELGYYTIPEAARILIENELEKGKSLEEVRVDELEFQRKVLKMKLYLEEKAPKEEVVFIDRGVPDSIAYFQIRGGDIEEVMKYCQEKNYEKIFFLEQIGFEKDHVRIEDEKLAARISELTFEAYSKLGYDVVTIPKMPIDERVKKILNYI